MLRLGEDEGSIGCWRGCGDDLAHTGPGTPAKRLRALLGSDRILVAPGVFNGLTALLAKEAGAEALYLSGAAFSASMGMPDVGLVTLDELRAPPADRPGDPRPPHRRRRHRLRERPQRDAHRPRAGGRAMCRDPARGPGRPEARGHLEGTRVVESEIFAEKVRAAATSRQHLVVVARTDARATLGFEEAVRRGLEYREAGADVIFPEALRSEDEFASYARCPARSWRT